MEEGKKLEPYSKLIKPNRFVYHVTYKRNRHSISRNGLRARTSDVIGFQNAVFAHNSKFMTLDWYPIAMDYYGWDYSHLWLGDFDKFSMYMINDYYDIWEIDTSLLGGREWFLDGVGTKEFAYEKKQIKDLFILSHGDIPVKYLRLCDFSEFYIYLSNGLSRFEIVEKLYDQYLLDMKKYWLGIDEEQQVFDLNREQNLERFKYVRQNTYKNLELELVMELKMTG